MNDIFGYAWEDIQRAQQGGALSRPIDTSRSPAPVLTDEDRAALQEHGSVEGLETAGLHGVADRLRRAGLDRATTPGDGGPTP